MHTLKISLIFITIWTLFLNEQLLRTIINYAEFTMSLKIINLSLKNIYENYKLYKLAWEHEDTYVYKVRSTSTQCIKFDNT